MTRYVSGLLFSEDFSLVALIKKNRPAFLDGRLSPIGGHQEPEDASAAHAVAREDDEEAGIYIPPEQWVKYADVINVPADYRMACFYATTPNIHLARTLTDEKVYVLGVLDVLSKCLVQPELVAKDLMALIGLALAVRDGAKPSELIYK
jgi:8-oxo-dGTP pyrophosphatase MutT (NUDIX family)